MLKACSTRARCSVPYAVRFCLPSRTKTPTTLLGNLFQWPITLIIKKSFFICLNSFLYFRLCPYTNDEKCILLFRLVLKPIAFWGSNSCNKVSTKPSATLGRTFFYFLAHLKPSPSRNFWSLFILSPSSLLYFPKLYLQEILPQLCIFYCFYEEEEGSSQSFHLAQSEAAERKQTALCCTVSLMARPSS